MSKQIIRCNLKEIKIWNNFNELHIPVLLQFFASDKSVSKIANARQQSIQCWFYSYQTSLVSITEGGVLLLFRDVWNP